MITRTSVLRQTPLWQIALAQSITDPAELLEILQLPVNLLTHAQAGAALFDLRVPRGFTARMRRGDIADPLLRQVLPLACEAVSTPGFVHDPVGDCAAMSKPGVLHKYAGRVLLTATGACAIHCRYCFRRHFPYAQANASSDEWTSALNYIAADPAITEIILSGGDPLTLSDRRLADFMCKAQAINHVTRVRIHTRLPVVLPERVTKELLAAFSTSRLRVTMVIHTNHAQEIDDTVRASLDLIKNKGIILLNQSVLLRGVNDNAQTLITLSETLFAAGVLPYYLHLLDKVQGAAHFDVDEQTAQILMAEMSVCLPGYLVPRLVREVAGAPHKISIASAALSTQSIAGW